MITWLNKIAVERASLQGNNGSLQVNNRSLQFNNLSLQPSHDAITINDEAITIDKAKKAGYNASVQVCNEEKPVAVEPCRAVIKKNTLQRCVHTVRAVPADCIHLLYYSKGISRQKL